MQNSLIPGLDFLNLSERQSENSNSSVNQREINLPIFGENFRIPGSLSNGNCRSLEEFGKEKSLREGVPEHFYQCVDLAKKKPVTLVRYKKLKSLDEELKDLLHELEIVRNLKHFNILQFHEIVSFQLKNAYLVYEPCVCFLSDLIDENVEELYQLPVIKNIMLQVFEALNYIHGNSIIHRNIQPNSIAIADNGCLKICNFRNAHWKWEDDHSIQTDDVRYQGPELLMGAEMCNATTDIWSAACILVQLLLRRPFYEENDSRHSLKQVFSIFGFPTEECWPDFFKLPEFSYFHYDKEKIHSYNFLDMYFEKVVKCPQNQTTMDLLQCMFSLDPKMRYTASQCSSHAFFSEEPKAFNLDEVAHCVNVALTKNQFESPRKRKKEG